MHDDHATDDDSATDYHFIDGDVLDNILSTSFSWRILGHVLLTAFSTMFSWQHSFDDVLDDNGDVLDDDNCVRVHPTVNNGLTARGVIKISMMGVEVCGYFQ